MLGSGDASAGAGYGDLLVTSLIVLAVVCVAAFVAVRVFGRLLAGGRARGAHLLDVVARVPLEPRRSLYVVAVAGKTLLVGTSEMGLSVLSELDAAEVKARVVPRTSFAEMVKQAWGRRRTAAATATATATVAVAATEAVPATEAAAEAAAAPEAEAEAEAVAAAAAAPELRKP